MNPSVIDKIITTKRADELLQLLSFAVNIKFSYPYDTESTTNKLKKHFSPAEIALFLEIQKQDKDKYTTSEGLTELKNYIENLPLYDITLSFEPSYAFIQRLYTTLVEKLNSKRLLNISIDPSIIGGLILTIDGSYYDFTLNTQFSQFFSKQEVIEKLR